MAVDIILDKNEANNCKDIEIVTPLKKFKSNMHLITSTPNKTPDNVLNNRLSVTNTKYDEYESFLYEQKFETTNNYESEDESTLVDEITKLETTLQNLEDSLGQVSPLCLKTNEDFDATNIDSVLNAETDAETLITIDEYYDSCYMGCSSDSKPKDKSSFLQSHSSFEPEQATSAEKNIFSKNSPEESQNTFNRTIFELSKHDSKDLPNLENKYFSSESCSNTDKSTSKQCPLINIDLTSQKKNEFFPSEFKNEFEFLPAEFRNEVGCLPAQFGNEVEGLATQFKNEVEGLATEFSKNKDTLLKCSEFDLYKDAFKCIKSNQNQDVDCLHKNEKPNENEQKYLEDGLDDDKDDCIDENIDEDKLLEGPEDNIDDKMRYTKTIAGNLNVAPANISESLKLLATQENESKLDDVTDKKISIKGSATMNREAKEFVSNDPKENEDNNNENWEVLRKLETDPERYKAMRKRWRNLVTPDPNKNLTIRRWKGKSLIQEGDGANSLVKLVPNERLSSKRKRSNDDNSVSKHQRSENHPCILFYEQKMDNLLRTMKDEVSFVDQEHQQALLRLGCKQQYESQNLENFMGKFFRFTPSGQQLYNKQSQVQVGATHVMMQGGWFLTALVTVLWSRHGPRVCAVEPGYLDFDNLPDTNFSCEGKVIGGYYADIETGCQMFHVCTIGQKGETTDIKFLCLNGTVFDQETRVCERVDEVDCSKTEGFFDLNLELYGNMAAFGLSELEEEVVEEEDYRGEEGTEDYPHEEDTFTHYYTSTTPSPPPPPPPPVIKTVTANFSITTENRSQPEIVPPVTRKPFVPTALSPQENKRPYSPTSHSYFNQGPQVNVQKPGESGVLSGGYRPPVTSTAVPGGNEHAKHQHRTQQILDLHKQGDKRQFVPTTQSPSHFFGVNNNPSGFSITTTHATNSAPFPSVQSYPEVVDYHRTFAVSPGFINQQLSHPAQTPTKSSIFVVQDDGHLRGDRQSPIVRAAQSLRSTIASHGSEFPSHHRIQLSHSPLTFHFNSHQPGHQLFTTPALAIVSTTSSTSKSLNGKGFQERPVAPPPIVNRSESYSFISEARPAVSINLTAPGPTSPQLFLETTAPGVYDEYQEHDVHTDPFFRDVPRIGKSNPTSTIVRRTTTTRRKRNTDGSSQTPTESQFKLEKSSSGLKNRVKKSHNKVTKISSKKAHKKKHKVPPSVPVTSFGSSINGAETESSKESSGLGVTGHLHHMDGPKADHSHSRHPLSAKTSLRPNFLNTKRITDAPGTKHEPLTNDRTLSNPTGLGSEELDTEGPFARDNADRNKERTTHRRSITVSHSSRYRHNGGSDKNSIQTPGVVGSRKTHHSDKPHRGGLEVSLLGGNSSEIKQVAINKTKPYTSQGQVRQNKPTDDKNMTYKYSTSSLIEVPSVSDNHKRNGSHGRQKRQLSEVLNGFQTPSTSFSCKGKIPGGYYADLGSNCQIFHICSQGRHGRLKDNVFWCGPGTSFNQISLTCQTSELVDCSLAPNFYYLNDHFLDDLSTIH